MGAEVVLTLDCGFAYADPACTDPEATVEKARFTIVAPDTIAPPGVDAITLEQEDGEFFLGCDDTSYDLRLGAVIDVGDAEPSTWVEVTFTKNGKEIASRSHMIPANGAIESSHHVVRSELAGAQTCVGVTVRDAAGNAAELEQDCTEIGGEGCGCTTATGPETVVLLFGALVLVARRRCS